MLRSADGTLTTPMTLPGDIVTALQDAALIPDPYAGQNEYDLRWICAADWTLTRDFDLADPAVDLVISELDTVATVRVNDVVVLEAANAFCTYRAGLGEAARAGRNTIAITFHSPVAAGKALSDAHPFPVPWSKNCPIPYGNFLRKPACDFGWDWNIALATSGVYGVLWLEPSQAARIDRLAVAQDHGDGVKVTIGVHTTHHEGPVTVSLAGQMVTADSRNGFCQVTIAVPDPVLWWPAGLGAQHLYDLTVTAGAATATRRIGLRRMELLAEPDAAGLGFKVRVNGHDVFCKGANWIPADALPGRITDAKTRALLQSAVDANMNMVRVWGGGRYEPDSFYDACDELGLLVWSEIPVYWRIDFANMDTLGVARRMLASNIRRDRNRASIAFWSVANETPISAPRNAFLRALIRDVRDLDDSRLVTAALLTDREDVDGRVEIRIDDPLVADLDVMAVNTYGGWYSHDRLTDLPAMRWRSDFSKPLIFSEFGAGALAGFRDSGATRKFSEEFQAEYYRQTLAMADGIPFLRGLSPWILKDFRAPRRQHPVFQQGWNRKGLISETGQRKQAFEVLATY
ncbi:MAG: hypothetical protein KKB02_06245, partial [Alphaproteobacteria bacterium]|nr:hypothetical protein [Alphaproteobacteria bacterium]